MARSTPSGSQPAASAAGTTPAKKTKKKAVVAVKKTASGASASPTPAPTAPARAAAKRAPVPTKAAAKTSVKKTPAAAPASGAGEATAASAAPAFGAKFLAQQHKALLEERENYTRQADSLRAEADALVADFEPGDVQFDEESGEGDTLNTERERDLALSAQARQAVEEITHALTKFADGTYGICEVSGDPIPVERLEAIPWARERVQYKTGGLGRR